MARIVETSPKAMLICPMPTPSTHYIWSKVLHAASIALLALLCLSVYSNTFDSPLLWDEREYLLGNPIVQDLSYYAGPSKAAGTPESVPLSRRYVGYLSFALNYKAHGYDVAGYHAVNTAIHVISAWLVYALGFALFGTARFKVAIKGPSRGLAALMAAALFAAHPVQTEAVTYVFQRLASMSAMFYLLSFVLYAYARVSGQGKARAALICISILSAILAMKTKETAFTLPFAIALYELVFHEGPWSKRALWLLPYAPLLLIVPYSVAGPSESTAQAVGNYLALGASQQGFTAYEYMLTQTRVIVTYMRMLILPVGQNLDHDYPLYTSALEPPVIASTMLILSLLASGIAALKRFRSGGPSVLGALGFGMLWFFLTLSVESSIIPIPMLMDEYRMYLPSVGWCIAFAAVSTHLVISTGRRTTKALIVIAIALPLALGIAAYNRNSVWESRVSLWEDVVSKSPLKLRGYNNLANAYMDAGLEDKALLTYKRALRPEVTNRTSSEALSELNYNLAGAYASRAMHKEAIEHLNQSISLMPENTDAHNNLGVSLQALGRYMEAVDAYYRALATDPEYANAYFNLGEAFHLQHLEGGNNSPSLLNKSIANYEAFMALRPDYPETYLNLSRAYTDRGDELKAKKYMRHYESLKTGRNIP